MSHYFIHIHGLLSIKFLEQFLLFLKLKFLLLWDLDGHLALHDNIEFMTQVAKLYDRLTLAYSLNAHFLNNVLERTVPLVSAQ